MTRKSCAVGMRNAILRNHLKRHRAENKNIFFGFQPEHFTASTRALDEFKSNSDALISDAAIVDDLCYVLPR